MNSANARRAILGEQSFGYLMLAPAVSLILLLCVYPIFRVLGLSFFSENLSTGLTPKFVGLLNYVAVLNDGHYWQTVRTTGLITVLAVATELVLGLSFALLLNEKLRGRAAARASALVPWALPSAIMALVWAWIFNDQYGVFNDLLMRAGILSRPVAWLGSTNLSLFCVILADVWKTTPFMMILLLAGLQNIPEELYEAAQIDGAGTLDRFRLITLPLLLPSIALAVLFRALGTLGIFDLIYVLTGGGPGGATETVAIYSYNIFLRYLDFGYGAAVIVVTTLLTALVGFAVYRLVSRFTGS